MITAGDRVHQARRAQTADDTARALGTVWADVDPDDIRESWLVQLARAVGLLAAGQHAAAEQAQQWMPDETGIVPTPSAFSGIASDGRGLDMLLLHPMIAALSALARGRTAPQAMGIGATLLQLLARTQVADAGRAADQVAITVNPRVIGYERVVNLPACSRCVILAGRLYRWSRGFQRHPQCDCTMSPVSDAEWQLGRPDNTPAGLFGLMSAEQQNKAFGKAGAEAIRDGADPIQIVNARRGMTTASAYGRTLNVTTEGTTRRALYGGYELDNTGEILRRRPDNQLRRRRGERYRRATTPRLMPEDIYRVADDRAHAIRLLGRYGYVNPRG